MNKLEQENSWIKTVRISNSKHNNESIARFFPLDCDENSVYVRLDDDIVFVDKHFFDNIFEYRINNPQYFLVYGNIINNAVVSHFHQKSNLVSYPQECKKICMDDIGWKDPLFAEAIHRAFINDFNNGNIQKWFDSFSPIVLNDYDRVSINCICWLGKTFKEFNSTLASGDEELWLSVEKPKLLNTPNVIFNNAIASHFSFYTQRGHLDSTDLLSCYHAIADKIVNEL
jgi:hypothetical protein